MSTHLPISEGWIAEFAKDFWSVFPTEGLKTTVVEPTKYT